MTVIYQYRIEHPQPEWLKTRSILFFMILWTRNLGRTCRYSLSLDESVCTLLVLKDARRPHMPPVWGHQWSSVGFYPVQYPMLKQKAQGKNRNYVPPKGHI